MSIEPEQWEALQPHVGDRIRKALEVGNVTVQEMADYLGIHRNSVGAWMNLRRQPSKQSLRLIALRTGVPFEWLETGKAPTDEPPGPGLVRRPGLEPGTRWSRKGASQGEVVRFLRQGTSSSSAA